MGQPHQWGLLVPFLHRTMVGRAKDFSEATIFWKLSKVLLSPKAFREWLWEEAQ